MFSEKAAFSAFQLWQSKFEVQTGHMGIKIRISNISNAAIKKHETTWQQALYFNVLHLCYNWNSLHVPYRTLIKDAMLDKLDSFVFIYSRLDRLTRFIQRNLSPDRNRGWARPRRLLSF